MSRHRVHEVSSPISLFPFIGILLCTMGALLVVLVAVSRSAHDSAVKQVESQRRKATNAPDEGVQKKLEDVKKYVSSLDSVRGEAERKLRDEQLRLSHVEDHIRRLQGKMRSLQLAAEEMEGLEKEHYDDREQATREIDRLHQLIAESEKTITSLREASDNEPRSYAVVPYEGPNGTFRRPIYIECLKDELILQPEGVRISIADLRPPFGAGNPLAAVLRAGRDHLVRLHPKEGQSRDTEPYPLLLVRPDGLYTYDRARQAIEAGDFELGFELVESDWKLKFPPPDPQLAGVQHQAFEQAKARQEVLAAAAPRAYHNPTYVVAGEFGFDEGEGHAAGGGGFDGKGSSEGSEGTGGGVGGGRPGIRSGAVGGTVGGSHDSTSGGVAGSTGGVGGPDNGGPTQSGTSASQGSAGMNSASSGGPGMGSASGGGGGNPNGTPGGGSSEEGYGMPAMAGTGDMQSSPDGSATPGSVSVMTGSPPPDTSHGMDSVSASGSIPGRSNLAENRDKDWALRQKPGRLVPIRRTIHVVVGQNELAVLPDDAPPTTGTTAEKAIPIPGDTVEALDEFVKQVRDQIDDWGIAGDGLYWRPVIVLKIAPNGQQRANDLTRLLKNSGLELRTDETARAAPEGTSNETR